MYFGEVIKQRRNDLKKSSIEIGQMVGCSSSFISGIERGAQFPSTPMACKILDALGMSYIQVTPLTLQLEDGSFYHFKSSLRGRNKESLMATSTYDEPSRDEKIRIAALNCVSHNQSAETIIKHAKLVESYIRGDL